MITQPATNWSTTFSGYGYCGSLSAHAALARATVSTRLIVNRLTEPSSVPHVRRQAPRRWLSTARAASAGCSSTTMWPAPGISCAVASGSSAR